MSKQNPIKILTEKQREVREVARQSQERIRSKMYEHGIRKRICKQTGLSPYKLRNLITDENASLEDLMKVEKALA